MSKLIVLSNRISMPSGKASAGGLAVAVQDALNDSNGIWLGWNGQQITDTEAPEFDQAYSHGIDYITCPLHISNMHSTTVVLPIKYYGLPCMIGMT